VPKSKAELAVAAYVHDSQVAASWHHSVLGVLQYDLMGPRSFAGWIAQEYGTDGLVEARNQAVRTFLAEHRADWLWWTDTDMGFAPDTLARLMAAADPVRRPVMGALCFTRRHQGPDGLNGSATYAAPTVWDWGELNGKHGFMVRWDYEQDTLTRVDGTGSACILIHRSVFTRMTRTRKAEPYDRIVNPETGELVSEDLSFCMRARRLNIPVHVHTGIRCSHLKQIWLTEENYVTERTAHTVMKPAR
jgi:hypothetical protein